MLKADPPSRGQGQVRIDCKFWPLLFDSKQDVQIVR